MQGRAGSAARRCPKCGAQLALDNTATLCGRCRRQTRDDVLSPPKHLNDGFFETEDFRAAFASQDIGKVLKVYRNHPAHIKLYGRAISQEIMGRWLEINQAQISRLESDDPPDLGIKTLRKYASKLDLPRHLLWFAFPGENLQTKSEYAHINASNRIRQGLSDVLATIQASELNADDWDHLVDRIGRDTRRRPPGALASELLSNLEDVRKFYSRATSGHTLRRLSRIAAQMSGLMSQTLLKVDDQPGSLDWAQTARLFAAESEDPELRAWVQAQEAYYYFYAEDLQTAIESAQYAQQVAGNKHSVGSALAAALEARAYAAQGKRREALQAIGKAETYTEGLDSSQTIASAFGYNEAQLRFHQSNSLTQLGEAKAAFDVQDRAIELCAPDDFMDRTLVHIDRADCLVVSGSVTDGLQVAKSALESLKASEARGLIVNRILRTLELVPSDEADSIDAQELREIVNLIQRVR